MNNPYRKSSNKVLLSDLKGLKEGKYINTRYGNKTSLTLAKEELKRRQEAGLCRSDAGKKKKSSMYGSWF